MKGIIKTTIGSCAAVIGGVISQEKGHSGAYSYAAVQPGQLTIHGLSGEFGTVYRDLQCPDIQFLQEGDVLIKRLNPDCAVIFSHRRERVLPSANIFVIRPKKTLIPEYLAFLLEGSALLQRISQLSGVGTTVSALTGSQIADGIIPLLPLKQQQALGRLWSLNKKKKSLLHDLLDENDRQMRAICGKLYQ